VPLAIFCTLVLLIADGIEATTAGLWLKHYRTRGSGGDVAQAGDQTGVRRVGWVEQGADSGSVEKDASVGQVSDMYRDTDRLLPSGQNSTRTLGDDDSESLPGVLC